MTEKLLLISPAFHGYCYSIADGFRALGYDTSVYRYDAFDTFQDKLRNKVRYELPGKIGFDSQVAAEKDLTARTIQAVRETKPDKVLIIKADALSQDFWSFMDGLGVPYALWLYDDLERHRYTMDFLKELPAVVSYARTENERFLENGVNSFYVPNGYDPALAEPPAHRTGEIVFVGSRYENREKMMLALHNSGVPIRAYGRQWSHHFFDRLRTWDLRRPDLPAERDIPLAEAYRVQSAAAASINSHIPQAGFAMRTFEVPGMNGLQLIDRPDVEEFYEVGKEVLLYRSTEELIELSKRVIADPVWSDTIRAAGLKRSQAEHTFQHRAQTMEQIWG